eukprot:SAG11_NODE_5974_length_1422_cov_0.811036_1_plen_21_part_10
MGLGRTALRKERGHRWGSIYR